MRVVNQALLSYRLPSLCHSLVALGVVFIIASFLPLQWATGRYWTPQDSDAFDRISLEYHESAFQSAARSGRTEEEMQAYRDELKMQFELMRDKLLSAQQQPRRWSQRLLWTGAVLAALGCISCFIRKP